MEHCYIKLAGEQPEKQTNMVNMRGQQLNSVLTLQLMGFFCCSNEIFCRDVGKYVLKQEDAHMHSSTNNMRHIERANVQGGGKRLINTILLLDIGCNAYIFFFYFLRSQSQTGSGCSLKDYDVQHHVGKS